MWKEHRYLITYPLIMSGMAIMAWKRGTVSEFNKWYLIIGGTILLGVGACGAPAGAEEGEGRAVRAEEPIL